MMVKIREIVHILRIKKPIYTARICIVKAQASAYHRDSHYDEKSDGARSVILKELFGRK